MEKTEKNRKQNGLQNPYKMLNAAAQQLFWDHFFLLSWWPNNSCQRPTSQQKGQQKTWKNYKNVSAILYYKLHFVTLTCHLLVTATTKQL